jgi:hypothetical protein
MARTEQSKPPQRREAFSRSWRGTSLFFIGRDSHGNFIGRDSHGNFIGRDSHGNWVAQDQAGLRGGLFINRAEAVRFAMREHGCRAAIMLPGVLELKFGSRLHGLVTAPQDRSLKLSA